MLNKKKDTKKNKSDDNYDNYDDSDNKGILKVDATCTPADVKYPTDLNLLSEGREKLENIIDTLYEKVKNKIDKPRTYRKVARGKYLSEAKKRRHTKSVLCKAIGKQLNYLRCDLKHISSLLEFTPISNISSKQYKDLLVINELYRQ